MYGKNWQSSQREYEPVIEKNVKIVVLAGHELDATLYRPESDQPFPVILSPCPYYFDDQVAPLKPVGFSHLRGHMEAGDPNFYVRRGYVQVFVNIRGTGASGGSFDNLGQGTIDDICDVIAWLLRQPWCDGNVGMFGASYFSLISSHVAARSPEGLKCVFAPFAWTDAYRDRFYHGGILNHGFTAAWFATLPHTTFGPGLRATWGDEKFEVALEEARQDPELSAVAFLRGVMDNPDVGENRIILELLLQGLDSPYYRERSVAYPAASHVAGYFGACWGVYGNHLPGAFRSYDRWPGPKKLTIGPPLYLDRPLYQYAYESLNWFDYWMKGIENGIMDESPITLFLEGSGGNWKTAQEWPLPETRWTPFYLHEGGLLLEHEFWPNEAHSTYVDSPYERGEIRFSTPKFVEATEICGPITLNFWASSSTDEVLWFGSLLEVDAGGNERLLTRGWLRGSHRKVDSSQSQPWAPYHPHTEREPLEPGKIYEFNLEIRPYAIQMNPGSSLVLRLKSVDDEEPATALQAIAMGHLWSPRNSRISVYHDSGHPSALHLPITRGNRIGMFMSGGVQEPPG
jgi:predicted acyl esterase